MSCEDERCVVPKATISQLPGICLENPQNRNVVLLEESKEDVKKIMKIYKEAHADLDKVWTELKKKERRRQRPDTHRRVLDSGWQGRSRGQFTSHRNTQKDGC
jgi:hypothetical protein